MIIKSYEALCNECEKYKCVKEELCSLYMVYSISFVLLIEISLIKKDSSSRCFCMDLYVEYTQTHSWLSLMLRRHHLQCSHSLDPEM